MTKKIKAPEPKKGEFPISEEFNVGSPKDIVKALTDNCAKDESGKMITKEVSYQVPLTPERESQIRSLHDDAFAKFYELDLQIKELSKERSEYAKAHLEADLKLKEHYDVVNDFLYAVHYEKDENEPERYEWINSRAEIVEKQPLKGTVRQMTIGGGVDFEKAVGY